MSGGVADRIDPLESFKFDLQIDAATAGSFTEISGLQAEVQTEDYFEGGLNDMVHKLPGRVRFANVTLRRGIVKGGALWTWINDVLAGTFVRKNVSIVLYTQDSSEKFRWTLVNAIPVKWVAPQLRAGDNALAVEALEFAYEGLQVAYSAG